MRLSGKIFVVAGLLSLATSALNITSELTVFRIGMSGMGFGLGLFFPGIAILQENKHFLLNVLSGICMFIGALAFIFGLGLTL